MGVMLSCERDALRAGMMILPRTKERAGDGDGDGDDKGDGKGDSGKSRRGVGGESHTDPGNPPTVSASTADSNVSLDAVDVGEGGSLGSWQLSESAFHGRHGVEGGWEHASETGDTCCWS
jgi:hypothetical protein